VASIRIVGGVEGQYVPEPHVQANIDEYRIPGFKWRDDRPIMNFMERQWLTDRKTVR
jgi:hypothetical protein